MKEYTRFVGIDQHKDRLVLAVAQAGRAVPELLGSMPNDPAVIARWVRRHKELWGELEPVLYCYEAGPCGYTLYRQLRQLGVDCQVVAPGLTPKRPTDRIKTDRRDATNLARLSRAGELTPVWVPDEEYESLRDLVRMREAMRDDLARQKQRLGKFLLRQGKTPPAGVNAWTYRYERWLDTVRFDRGVHQTVLAELRQAIGETQGRLGRLEQDMAAAVESSSFAAVVAALQCLRGFELLTAVTVAVEMGERCRFATAREAMSYSGLVPGEDSSGKRVHRQSITKVGNDHLRRVLVEAAWHYRHQPCVSQRLKCRQRGQPAEVLEISWRAQQRLHKRYRRLLARGKEKNKTVVAVARELVGFVWEILQVVVPGQAGS